MPSCQQILIRKLIVPLEFAHAQFYLNETCYEMSIKSLIPRYFRSVSVVAEANELNELKPSTSCISLVVRELNGPNSSDSQAAIVYFNAEVILAV